MIAGLLERAIGQESFVGVAPDDERVAHELGARALVAVVGVGGANASHMDLASLAQVRGVHGTDIKYPTAESEIPGVTYYNTATEEGTHNFVDLIESGQVDVCYISLVPALHERFLKEMLGYAADGLIKRVVIAKPVVVGDRDQVLRIDALVRETETCIRERDPEYDFEKNPVLSTHEHYLGKEVWKEFLNNMGALTDLLGRPEAAEVNLMEYRTALDEERELAFEGGALEDLGPHVISLGLSLQSTFNALNERYYITDKTDTDIELFHYDENGSALSEGVDTGFVVHGYSAISERGEELDPSENGPKLSFTWRGGKGVVDDKSAIVTFVHAETGVRTSIKMDLARNCFVDIPESTRHLLPSGEFIDNGYKETVVKGLSGEDPSAFQPWKESRKVELWRRALKERAKVLRRYELRAGSVALRDLRGDRFNEEDLRS